MYITREKTIRIVQTKSNGLGLMGGVILFWMIAKTSSCV